MGECKFPNCECSVNGFDRSCIEEDRIITQEESIARSEEQDFRAQVREKLTKLQVGGCTCMTKTPDIQYHDASCKYRLATELSSLLHGKGII